MKAGDAECTHTTSMQSHMRTGTCIDSSEACERQACACFNGSETRLNHDALKASTPPTQAHRKSSSAGRSCTRTQAAVLSALVPRTRPTATPVQPTPPPLPRRPPPVLDEGYRRILPPHCQKIHYRLYARIHQSVFVSIKLSHTHISHACHRTRQESCHVHAA